MVIHFLWDISLQERQERISPSGSGSIVARVSGGGGGRSGHGFRRIVLGEFRSEVGGEGGSLGWSGSRELFYGTNVVIGGLRRDAESRVSFEG